MSTTSLSSCDDYDYYPCGYVLEDNYERYMQSCQGAFYNMRQPLVYYAEVQPQCRRSMKGRRKETRNCFARAFKWYTQEREPECCRHISPELSGFATWLDAKYGQYLRESEQTCCPPQPPPSIEATSPCPPCGPCQPLEPGTTKRYTRMRSPWRKFRGNNKNAGDVPCKTSNGSCQFILQPKDLTRPASECYYQTPPACPNKSNTTVISTELEGTKRTIVKSQSMTSICVEKVNATCIDVVTTQEGPKVKQGDAQKIRAVEKAPQVRPSPKSPCDQSCKIKPEGKSVTKIQSITARAPKRSIPCDNNRCVKESKPLPTKPKNIDIPCDPNCCKEGCKPVAEIRPPAQNKEIPYDPNCCNPECKSVEKLRMSIETRKIELPYDPKCCNVECKSGEERVSSPAPNIGLASDCRRQECTPTGNIRQSFTKSQVRDVPCDPTCIYKQTSKPPGELRNNEQARNVIIPCEPSCYTSEYKPPVVGTQRSFVKSQVKNVPFDKNCIYQQSNKPAEEIQNMFVPCEPTCYKPEYKLVGEIKQSFTKSQVTHCDPNCAYKQTYKPTCDMINNEQPRNMQLLCDPNCYKPNCKPAVATQRIPTKAQVADIPCDPSCTYKQENKPAGEIRMPAKERSLAIPCDPSCSTQEYKTAGDLPCDPNCIYRQPVSDTHKVSTKTQNIATICDCIYKPESKTARAIPTKPQTVEVSCDCDPNIAKEIQRSTSKSQGTITTCLCYPTKIPSKIKKVPSKVQKVDHECQCPEDDTMLGDAQGRWGQTFASTTTNNTLCQCIEKPQPTPAQVCKPAQPPPKAPSRRLLPFNIPKKSQKPVKTAETSCQCPEDDIIKFDAPSQYDRYRLDTHCDCACPTVKPEKPRVLSNIQRPESRTRMNYSSVAVRQVTRSLTTFRNDAVQTSDHSICLEDVGHDYAFFMKIVCADKLNDCFCDSFTR